MKGLVDEKLDDGGSANLWDDIDGDVDDAWRDAILRKELPSVKDAEKYIATVIDTFRVG